MSFSQTASAILPKNERAALLVIDVQERLTAAMPTDVLPMILRNIRILIESARQLDIPTLVSEQYPKGLGPTVESIRSALPNGSSPIPKRSFSCCGEAAFQPVFQQLGSRQDIILCGMETHVCVLQTALDLRKMGFNVYIAADAVSSRTKFNWRTGLELMQQAGAIIGSTETFAFGLLGTAGTDQFKAISRLVKE
jgi:nicotinamidase-related amidase